MRYAIISDIHSNLEGLEKCLDKIDEVGVDQIVCLGDIVGYGANPNECTEVVRQRCEISLKGNHDIVACANDHPYEFNPMAKDAILWTREALSDENKRYLDDLPEKVEMEEFIIVHGAISDPGKYIHSPADALTEFGLMNDYGLCFFGHTHITGSFELRQNMIGNFQDLELAVEDDAKYIVNPGSVGQPRDKDPRASFLIFDSQTAKMEFHRLNYNMTLAQRKILEAGLDERLAIRLTYGI